MVNYQNGKIYKIVSNTDDDICYVGSTTNKYLCQRMTKHKNNYKVWKNGKTNNTSSYELFEKYGFENCRIELLELVPCNSRDELTKKEAEYIRALNCVNKVLPDRTLKEWYKEYYDENKESLIQYQKEYRIINEDKIKERTKIHYEENKSKFSEKAKEYRETNKDKISERRKKYYEENKSKISEKQKKRYEENKSKISERAKEYRKVNKSEISEKRKKRYEENKGEILKKQKKRYEENKSKISEKAKDYYEANKDTISEKGKQKYTCCCGSISTIVHKLRHEKTKKHMDFITSQVIV